MSSNFIEEVKKTMKANMPLKPEEDRQWYNRSVASVLKDGMTPSQKEAMEEFRLRNSNNLVSSQIGDKYYFPSSEETRSDIIVSVGSQGGLTVGNLTSNLMSAIRNKLVLKDRITTIDGQREDLDLINYSGTTAFWKSEIEAAQTSPGTFSSVRYSPHRLTAYIDVSKQIFHQNLFLEKMLMNDLAEELASKIEEAMFTSQSIASAPQRSIFKNYTPASSSYSGAVSWANITALERTANTAGYFNTSASCYITNAKGLDILKNTLDVNDVPLVTYNRLNGYQILATENIKQSTGGEQPIVFGDFSQFYLVNFGGTMLIRDIYTLASSGVDRLWALTYVDFGLRFDNAVATGSLK
jgi:HK97 family phage major capsid protein